MSLLFTIFDQSHYFILSISWYGWVGFVVWLGILGYALFDLREYDKTWAERNWITFIILLISTPITSALVGLQVPLSTSLLMPELMVEINSLPLMFFSALPWLLAGGLLGPFAASILSFISGLIIGYWGTHSLFTSLELATLSILISIAIQQRYRTILFRGLRHPLISSILISLVYPLLFLVSVLLSVSGSLVAKLDYALTHTFTTSLIIVGPILLAGLFAEFVRLAFPHMWGGQQPWQPSPPESSLEARFSYILAPAVITLLLLFILGDWLVAGRAARELLLARMSTAAEIASESVPYFLDTGQNLALQIASTLELESETASVLQLQDRLSESYRSVPFFGQLFILNSEYDQIAGYPAGDFYALPTSPEERVGLDMAFNGVPVQVYAIPALSEKDPAQISFLAAIFQDDGSVGGILVGRTDLISNPYTQSILTNLNSVSDIGGMGLLINEDGEILYHSESEWVFSEYPEPVKNVPDFFDATAPDGTRLLIYSRLTEGRSWATVMMVPARQAQQLALNTAAPLLVMVILLVAFSALLLRISLNVITSSIKSLTREAEHIAQGQLDRKLDSGGVDEVGRLGNSFEKMRVSLKARLDELSQLLLVSQGVASSLKISEALQPIVESALSVGASFARIVLTSDVIPDIGKSGVIPSRYGAGERSEIYQYFDDQILVLMKDHEQGRIILTNPARTPLLSFGPDAPQLGSLIAVALYHERFYYGVLWVGNDRPQTFTDEEIQFITTLGGQAALAAANTRLFMTAEFERERLAAILASTPDPVLVTDQNDCLLLVNAETWRAFGMGIEAGIGRPVEQVIDQDELVKLLRLSDEVTGPVELRLNDGKTFMATASTIGVDGQKIGRVCLLKDVTEFKELDALKTEFVSTVSHDLRSPLTLMRGYATMLEMVGDLNEQQLEYVRKIVVGVENISRLVNNLLDLGRIEAGVGLQLEMLPVRETIESIMDAFQLQAQQKRIKLQSEVAQDTPPLLEADSALLQQALNNLVENAVKYTPDGGKVWIRVKPRQNSILFIVEDTGIGISPVDQPHLFEKFYRSADRRAKQESGSGLGLAIVKSIVERHGGHMGLESRLGEGSVFFIDIPLRHSEKGQNSV